jgi:hypothetical protein
LNIYPSISTTNVEYYRHRVGKGYGGIMEEAADGASKRAEEEIIHALEYALNRPACLPSALREEKAEEEEIIHALEYALNRPACLSSALREERAEETQDPEYQDILFRAPIARRTLPLPLRSVGGDPDGEAAGVKERRR